VTVFARQGIAISTIARAMAIPADRVTGMCERARENDELQMMPPALPDDPRHAMLAELTNLRAQLDEAQETIRQMIDVQKRDVNSYIGVARLTRTEAKIVSTIVRFGRTTKAGIYHAMYGHLGDDEQREPKIVDVMISKIRKKLRPVGVEITTQWGVGWSMSQEDVARLKALAAEELATIAVPRVDAGEATLQPELAA